ncbi:MAG: NAD(P)H-hydrate dehydratase, partial [Phycisphaerae bacterium]|nr:NAD(P)H-hydrate dehydratase [Phycisphaerae bacterium]
VRPGESGGGGSYMVGGAAMAALASLRAGAGLVKLVLPEPVLAAGLAIAASATGVPLSVDEHGDVIGHRAAAVIDELMGVVSCVAVGPGLGVSAGASAVVFRCCVQEAVPVVLDADALNNLSAHAEFHRDLRAPAILTPHVGEFRRLAEAVGVKADPVDESSRGVACGEVARRLGCVVVLKSSATVVSDGLRVWVHDEPNAALATAGTGDVLCGVIAGLVAQHFRGGLGLYECARAGVAAHGLAARAWSERHRAHGGMLAMELLEEVPGVVERMRG